MLVFGSSTIKVKYRAEIDRALHFVKGDFLCDLNVVYFRKSAAM